MKDVESAWRQEVAARVAATEAGGVTTTPWEEIRDRYLARLREPRQGGFTPQPALDEWLDRLSRLTSVSLSAPAAESVRQAREEEDATLTDTLDRS